MKKSAFPSLAREPSLPVPVHHGSVRMSTVPATFGLASAAVSRAVLSAVMSAALKPVGTTDCTPTTTMGVSGRAVFTASHKALAALVTLAVGWPESLPVPNAMNRSSGGNVAKAVMRSGEPYGLLPMAPSLSLR